MCGHTKLAKDLASEQGTSKLIDPLICRPCRRVQLENGRAATAAAIDAQYPPRTCNACGETKPASQMAPYSPSKRMKRTGPSSECRDCVDRRRRGGATWEVWQAVKNAPDKMPAVMMRELLAYAKRAGLDFDDAFPEANDIVLESISGKADRHEWAHTFAWSERFWQTAYEGRSYKGTVLAPLTEDMLEEVAA